MEASPTDHLEWPLRDVDKATVTAHHGVFPAISSPVVWGGGMTLGLLQVTYMGFCRTHELPQLNNWINCLFVLLLWMSYPTLLSPGILTIHFRISLER